jgi:hypothetical protein
VAYPALQLLSTSFSYTNNTRHLTRVASSVSFFSFELITKNTLPPKRLLKTFEVTSLSPLTKGTPPQADTLLLNHSLYTQRKQAIIRELRSHTIGIHGICKRLLTAVHPQITFHLVMSNYVPEWPPCLTSHAYLHSAIGNQPNRNLKLSHGRHLVVTFDRNTCLEVAHRSEIDVLLTYSTAGFSTMPTASTLQEHEIRQGIRVALL